MKIVNLVFITIFAFVIYWSLHNTIPSKKNEYVDQQTETNTPRAKIESSETNSIYAENKISPPKNEPTTIETLGEKTYPKKTKATTEFKSLENIKYIEIFEGIDTKPWYYKGQSAENIKKNNKLLEDHGIQTTERLLTRLLELKEDDVITFEDNASLKKILDEFHDTNNKSVTFVNGSIYTSDDTSLPLETPLCKITFAKRDEVRYKSTGRFFYIGSSEIFEFKPDTFGVRIHTKKRAESDEKSQIIQTIECFVKSTVMKDEKFKKLNLLHLSATLANQIRFSRAK